MMYCNVNSSSNCTFGFIFFICKLDKSLCTSLGYLMIEIHKNVIRYKWEHGLCNVNKNVNNAASLQMARFSLIDENLIQKITVETLFGLMSTLENCLISTYLLCFSTRTCSYEKKLLRYAEGIFKNANQYADMQIRQFYVC